MTEEAASRLVRSLAALGLKQFFGLCGDHLNPIFHACLEQGIDMVSTRHEAAAVHMADAWARATGSPAVAMVNGGPGLTNALTGIATAHLSSVPVVVIAGQYATNLKGRGALQEIDQAGLLEPVTKWTYLLDDPNRIFERVASGLQLAISGRPGPVAFLTPVDVMTSSASDTEAGALPPTLRLGRPDPASPEWEAFGRLVAKSERPVVIAGSGAYWDRCQEALLRLADCTSIPVFTIDLARGLLPDRHPAAHGYPDPALNPAARTIERADLVILLGHNLDYRTEFGRWISPSASVVQVTRDVHEHSRNRVPAQLWHTEMSGFADMVSELGASHRTRFAAWNRMLHDAAASLRSEWVDAAKSAAGPGVHPIDICEAVAPWVDDRTTLVLDAGDFTQWPRAYLPANRSGAWLRLGPMAALGASIPFGNAAQLARPEDRVVAFIGDGGFGFLGWELHTAMRRGLPIKVIIGNDGKWGTELRLQAKRYGSQVLAVDVGDVAYDAFARSLGAWGGAVHEAAELSAALEEFMTAPGPSVLDVKMRTSGQPTDQV
jgi:acetolactate synthase I/II/III large subunit